MATYIATIGDFTMRTTWYVSSSYVISNLKDDKQDKTFDFTNIPVGSAINSAVLTADYNRPLNGARIRSVDDWAFSGELNVQITPGGTNTYRFRFESYTDNNKTGNRSSVLNYENVKITVDYTPPYTKVNAPTSVTVSPSSVVPSGGATVSWSGASGGNYTSVASYTLYRSTSANSGYTAIKSGITGTSYSVTAPSSNGSKYYYKVKAVSNISGYDSDLSSATAILTCSYSAPSVSGVKLNNSTSNIYVSAGSNVTLSWTGANGTNNPITSYTIKRNGADYKTGITGSSLTVPSHSSSGSSYYYSVQPIGSYSNGSAVNSPTVYSYVACTAPTNLSVSANNVAPSASVTLSWSGAGGGGSYNTITGYLIYRSTAYNGTYSHIATVDSTSTSGSATVTAPSGNGSSYYYKIITRGNRANSGYSGYTSLTCSFSAPSVSNVSLSSQYAASSGSVTLSWSAANGTNNPVQSYTILRGGSAWKTGVTGGSYTITAHATAGQSYQYAVQAIGAYSNSGAVNAPVLYTYGNPSAPSSVSVSPSTVDVGTNATLSWSGAAAGSYNAITKYYIYRSTAYNGSYSHIATVNSTSTSGSATVTAHSTMGSAYYYKVITGGTHTNSGYSGYASLTSRVYTAVTAPTAISLSPSTVDAGANSTLSWSGAGAGTNNAITGYKIYRSIAYNSDYTHIATVSSTATSASATVTAHSSMGGVYYYKVETVGTKSGYNYSGLSGTYGALTSRTYSGVIAPTSISLSQTLANPSKTVTLSWSGAQNGTNVTIAGYDIYVSIDGGSYSLLSQQGASVSSISVTSNANSGSTQSYKIKTIANKSGYDSGFSSVVQLKTNTAPTAPQTVNLSHALYESGNLTISFSAGGDVDGNLSHYQIQRRIQTSASGWGSWTNLVTDLTTLSYNDTPSIERGYGVQYRVKSHDALGLYSDYKESAVCYRNQLPITPAIVYPANGSSTYNTKPTIRVSTQAEPDSTAQFLQVAIDSGGYVDLVQAPTAGGNATGTLASALSIGTHTLKFRLRDNLGAVSGEVSTSITVKATDYTRTIAKGGIIANDSISHQAEIKQLYEQINEIRAYYGLSAIAIPTLVGSYENVAAGNIGMFAAWGSQMMALQQAITDTKAKSGLSNISWQSCTNGMYPKADIINQIRNEIVKA